jgi:hypothetical protein
MLKDFPSPPDLQEFVILQEQPAHPDRLKNVASTCDNKERNGEISGINKSWKWEYREEFSS